MKKIKLLALLIAVVLLIGCASGAKFENMAYTETSKFKYEQALKKEIGLSGVEGGEKTNPLWTSEISNEAFQEALKLSLASQGLMSDNARYQLKVNLVKVDQPLFGLDLKVTTHVNYILTDTKTNKVVLDELVVAPFTATFGDAAIAIKRLRLANEGSGKNNIKGFLQKLSLLNVSAISLAN